MATDTIERLYKLTINGTQAARSLANVEQSASNLDKRMADSIKGIEKFGKALAAAVSAGAIVHGIKAVIDSFDQLSKDAQKFGIAAEELQRLRFAADMSGVAAEQMDTAIGKLATTMQKLGDESSDVGAALRRMGVESGDSATDALKKIADQFAKMLDGIEKTALSIQLFGKAGADMIPMLNAGAEGFQELANEADRFGGVISSGVLAQAEAFNDDLSRLERTAKGVVAQLTAGMLPALRAFTQSLVDSASSGEGFVTTGASIGEVLLTAYSIGLKAVATLQAFGLVLAGVAAAVAHPGEVGTIFDAVRDDINALEGATNTKLAKLSTDLAKFKAEAAATTVPKPPSAGGDSAQVAADKLAAANKRAAEAARELKKANDEMWKSLQAAVEIQEANRKASDEQVLVLNAQAKAILEVDTAAKAYLDSIELEGARLQYLIDLTDESSDAYRNSTEAQRAYAAAQLAGAATTTGTTQTLVKQRDELDVLTEGFDGFFSNLASGAADVEEVFKRMVQSIIAELLKLWAKKYIVDAIAGAFGFKAAATGAVFDGGEVVPFARGGVISAPLMFPMALAGEAGPEAIMPLRRTASGDLGIQAQQQPMQITINNNAPNVQVDTRTTPGGLEVIISQVKASLTADILRGGNDFATASERAWGLSRGSAAAF